MKDYRILDDFLIQNSYDFSSFEPLSRHTTFAVGGAADRFINVDSTEKLYNLIVFLTNNKIPYYIIGNGSNLLVSDKGISCAVVHLSAGKNSVTVDGEYIHAFAGAPLSSVCSTALNASLTGLEFAWGIPASVGGAAFMNAGAYDSQMKNVVKSVKCITPDLEIVELQSAELGYSYRHSVFEENGYIVAEVCFALVSGETSKIKARMDELMQKRIQKQPLDLPSAGSTFKRPEGAYAAALIDECGLKGLSVGGARVSEKHAGFIVNRENATAKDIAELIKRIQQIVFDKKRIKLETEVIKIGDWE